MQINIGWYGKELEILKVHRTSAVRRKKYEQIAVYFHSDFNSSTATVYPRGFY